MDENRKIEVQGREDEQVEEPETRMRPRPPERDSSGGYEIKPPDPVPPFGY